ncbi:NADPH:quinone oxidoreductase family protein [Rhodococcus sp. NPDC127530]|uniref:NADPH:quinone oxidoreductase family protein n=1 Tax=unclassified Rhodococcus (in: high G+C Gram-positive bacteria) TaxID=192944 RepID=UPI003630AC4C
MKAWRAHGVGEPRAVLRFDDLPTPSPGPGEVVIDVESAAVNFPDLLLCRDLYHHRPDRPFGLGCEAAGTVSAVGPDVELTVGQRVVTAPMSYGCFATRVRVPAATVLPVPDSLPTEQAAALFMAYQTGWVGLNRRAGLRSGETLLVYGGAGGVGSAAVQIGKAAGATVIAVAGGTRKVEACRRLGADVVIDHTRQDVVAAVKDSTAGRGVDVVFDPVGGPVFDQSRRVVATEGRILVVGFASGELPVLPVTHALIKNYAVIGFRLQPFREDPAYVRHVHDELLTLHAKGQITPQVHAVMPMADAPAAVARLADREIVGRIVLSN